MIEEKNIEKGRWRAVLTRPKAMIGLVIVIIFITAALLAPVIAKNNPLEVDITRKLEKPSTDFWLGTDQLGRCIFSRLVWGGRTSLLYSFTVLSITLAIGVPIGLISGYVGGKVDNAIMRVVDIFMAMPSFMVALAIAGTLGASGENLVFAMSLVFWSTYARLTRGLTIQVKELDFVMASRSGGCGHFQIVFKHIMKNIMPSIISIATIEIGAIILGIAGFSFIGLGVQAPTPEWGIMLSDSRNFIQTAPRLMMYPGIVIIIVVLAFNLIGEEIKNGIAGEK